MTRDMNAFTEWMKGGNVIYLGMDAYIEQSTQWRRTFTEEELKEYFFKQILES